MKKRFLHVAAFVALSMATVFAQDITVFDFDGTSPAFTGGDTFVSIPNPVVDGLNSSANVGVLTHLIQWNDMSTVVNIDPRVYTSFEMMVYSPFSTTGKVQIACYDASGAQLGWYETNVTVAGVWTKITQNLAFTKKIAKVMVGFNRNSAPSVTTNDNFAYFDNLVFKKSTSTSVLLYNETFFPSWSATSWATWTGAPILGTGKWIGGVDLASTGDVILKVPYDGSIYNSGHVLTLTPTSTDVIISPITNLTGFKNLSLSVDISWPYSSTESAFYSATAVQKTISISYKTDINYDGIIDVNDGNWIPLAPAAIAQAWATQVFPLPLSTKIVALQLSKGACLFTSQIGSIKIIGEVDNTTVSPQNKLNNITIYPNPAKEYINVKGAKSVNIFDLSGKNVLSTLNVERIDIRSLSNGVFIVKANTGSETIISKLIKE